MKEAEEAGAFGVRSALDGVNGMMVAFKRACDEPYLMECFLADVNEICNKEKKRFRPSGLLRAAPISA